MVDTLSDLNTNLIDEEYQCEFDYRHNGGTEYKSLSFSTHFFEQIKDFYEQELFYDIRICTKLPPISLTTPTSTTTTQNSDNLQLNQLQQQQQNRDTSYEIKAHKIVLASVSDYFRAQFTNNFTDSNVNTIYLDINYDILKLIINYVYTGKLLIKDMNIISYLLPASVLLSIKGITDICCSYLTKNINSGNAIGIAEFARAYGCMKLAKYADEFICRNCAQVLHSDEFLNLTDTQLCNLLGREELNIPCESIIFRAIIEWVKYDPEKRRASLDCLFKCVRYHYLTPQFLKEQIKSCDILKYQEAQRIVTNIQHVISDLIAHKPCPYEQRKPKVPFGLYIIGGYQRQSVNLVDCYKFSSHLWETCAEMRHPRSGIACVSHAFYIYAIGGRNNSIQGNVDCANVECYDPILNSWRDCASMSVPRSRAGAAVVDGLIYVCGGAFGSQYHASVEKYCPLINQWMPVQSMLMSRIGLGCAVVNRLLYAIGGYDGKTRLKEVECYDPETNSWSPKAPMLTARSGCGCSPLNNYIYVVGGYTADVQLNSAERYDVITNQWSFIKSMNSPRSALACVTWFGRIFAIGGYTGQEFLSKIECYNPEEDKWIEVTPMKSERSGHGAAISVEMV